MDAVEHMAISKPLCARQLSLATVANSSGKEERQKAMGRDPTMVRLVIK